MVHVIEGWGTYNGNLKMLKEFFIIALKGTIGSFIRLYGIVLLMYSQCRIIVKYQKKIEVHDLSFIYFYIDLYNLARRINSTLYCSY